MCTLTILPTLNGALFTMNRDEGRYRDEANRLNVGESICYPVDPVSNGSWIGMNDQGMVGGLLNHYQGVHHANAAKSRGVLVPTALKQADMDAVVAYCDSLNLSDFNPFDLIIYLQGEVFHFTWSGEEARSDRRAIGEGFFLTSSALRLEDVKQYRQAIFDEYVKEYLGYPHMPAMVMSSIHLYQDANDLAKSVLMRRDDAHTKSITQIRLSPDLSAMRYWPEPCFQEIGTELDETHAIDFNFSQMPDLPGF